MSHLPATRAIHVHRRLRSGRRKNGAAHRAIHACTDGSSRLCAHVRMSRCDKIRAAAGLHSALTIRASTTPAPPPDKTPAPQPYPHGTAVRLEFPSEGGGRSVGEHPRDRRGSGKWMPDIRVGCETNPRADGVGGRWLEPNGLRESRAGPKKRAKELDPSAHLFDGVARPREHD